VHITSLQFSLNKKGWPSANFEFENEFLGNSTAIASEAEAVPS
jgi:hypothetical protein